MGEFLMVVILIIGIVLIVSYVRAWNRSQSSRQARAEEQRQRNGGEAVLEWTGPKAHGEPDAEFGELYVEIPKKNGGHARFYRRGLVLNNKRISYDILRDVAFAERTPALIQTPKTAAVMWLYLKKGMGKPMSVSSLQYEFEDPAMRAIQAGLGFGQS